MTPQELNIDLIEARLTASKYNTSLSAKSANNKATLGSIDDAKASRFNVDTLADDDATIISARDMVNRKFTTIGLTGKYKPLIGDPERGFSMMIYGKPKQGKSTLAIDFAKEIAPLGKVLYIAYEEGHGLTLQDKIIRNKADIPNLYFANRMPKNLQTYRFVFIDSVSDAGLDEHSFKSLIKQCKTLGISIIGVFHATKQGNFRGGQQYAHDVDIIIEVESGQALASGRYAPPTSMAIFNNQ